LVRRFVLDAVCDDFENVDQVILRDVARNGSKCGLAIDRPEVIETLRGLAEDGLVKAYDLTASGGNPFSGELPCMPSLEVVEEDFRTYFYITKDGMDIQRADASEWPFDAEGELRPDWQPCR
jgi:hypothetical protein